MAIIGVEQVDVIEGPRHSAETQGKGHASHTSLIFALVIIAVFLDVMDFSVVNVALPVIETAFSTSLAQVQWIIGAYGLTMAGFLMLSGRAGDIYGQKKLFMLGIVIFTLSSFFAGAAPSLTLIIALRAVQGIGAAISSVTAFSIFIILFPEGKSRNRAMGIFMAVLSAGFAAGALAGGFLTAFLGWRSVFYINVPIGIVAALLINKYLPEAPGRSENRHLDLPGAVTLTAGLMLLVYAFTVASAGSLYSLQTIIPLILAVAALAVFVYIESRSRAPLMPLGFARQGMVLNSNAAVLVMAVASGGLGVLVTVFMQQVLDFSPLYAGLGFLPPALIFFVIGGWGLNPIIERIGPKKAMVGSAILIAIGIALLIPISVQGGYLSILPGTVLWALGASIAFPVLSLAAVSGIKQGEEGLATGLVTTSQRIGFPIGLAVLVAIAAATTPAGMPAKAATVIGYRNAFIVAELLSILTIFIVLRLKVNPNAKPVIAEGFGMEFAEADLP